MPEEYFSPEVSEKVGIYVYRLVDPRNGETFYVGKGQSNRVFEHAKGEIKEENKAETANKSETEEEDFKEDFYDLKLNRIQDIKQSGLEVIHIIHRHNIKNDETAYEIEAALIDAYPGLTNLQNGRNSGDYGCRHAQQIIAEYSADTFTLTESLILICINNSHNRSEKSIYECVRGAWKMRQERAKKYKLVLAHANGIVLGAYRPKKWLKATRENFWWVDVDCPERIGFEGEEADCWDQYVGKRVPEQYRKKGAANPVRYIDK